MDLSRHAKCVMKVLHQAMKLANYIYDSNLSYGKGLQTADAGGELVKLVDKFLCDLFLRCVASKQAGKHTLQRARPELRGQLLRPC